MGLLMSLAYFTFLFRLVLMAAVAQSRMPRPEAAAAIDSPSILPPFQPN